CICNGLSLKNVEQGDPTVKEVEMFFFGVPRLIPFSLHMPNLQTLCITGQLVEVIEGLQGLSNLKTLWICECNLKIINGLQDCVNLQKLYLHGNQIGKIENLNKLTRLEVLWLNENLITKIEGITALEHLKEFNVAQNRITEIGDTLASNTMIENLNLSGNLIRSLQDITNLSHLKKLRVLSLKDPQYAANPVCSLCNYSTHILYHLPQVKRLDLLDVSSKQLQEMVEAAVTKKKIYYNMCIKTIQRKSYTLLSLLKKEKEKLAIDLYQRIRTLIDGKKDIESRDSSNKGSASETEEDNESSKSERKEDSPSIELSWTQRLRHKRAKVTERIEWWDDKINQLEKYYNRVCQSIDHERDEKIKTQMIEFETGGNIRFEEGSPSDIWYSSCRDLLLSRFCASDYMRHGINGLIVHRVTRIHNRFLQSRFDQRLTKVSERGEIPEGSSYKQLLEFLFYIKHPTVAGNDIVSIAQQGFPDASMHKKQTKIEAVPFTNSLNLCDTPRIHYLQERSSKDYGCPFRTGQIVIAKVFLGKSAAVSDSKSICQSDWSKFDCVFRPRSHDRHLSSASSGDLINGSQTTNSCDCNARQCEWFFFDNEIIVPEYIVDFEYVTQIKDKSPFSCLNPGFLSSSSLAINSSEFSHDAECDNDILQSSPKIRKRPRIITMSEEGILQLTSASSLTAVQVLNLHGNGLARLKHLNSMPCLKELTVSFNELSRVDDIANMQFLEKLNLMFNKITSLEGLKSLPRLKQLNLSWNQLSNTRDNLAVLRKHTPGVNTLDISHNPWQKPVNLRLRVIGRLKSLRLLDGIPVSEEESANALRLVTSSRISQTMLLAHSRTDNVAPHTFKLASVAEALCSISRLCDDDSEWPLTITALNLDNQHLTKISNLAKLENLRWASFNSNYLTKIENLESCVKVEELSLENNSIYRLDGLSSMRNLRRLHLRDNFISSINSISYLTHLEFLSLENNNITSLLGLQDLKSLSELYISHNALKNIREIFLLKTLSQLIILDLSGNSLEESDNYRTFVIYHLRNLKALDGKNIDVSEQTAAKEIFGGRLTKDFIVERVGHSNFHELRELDYQKCSIRHVDFGDGVEFLNLRSVNLEHNNLTSFSGLVRLINLKVLCLNHNRIESIIPRMKTSAANAKGKNPSQNYSYEDYSPILDKLEVLHLGYNGIANMAALQLFRLKSLKALFLQGNEIAKIEGLEGLSELRELVLDRNKIKTISENSFVNQWRLMELHLEENRIRDLSNFHGLDSLQRLYLSSNKIQELSELENLSYLKNLVELSLIGNQVTRRMMHRPLLIFQYQNLISLDGIPVLPEERTKAELYFYEQQ
ncbi:uncharacterized protein TRIADDRAFT_10167, partial [Trichoplax adhaerens]